MIPTSHPYRSPRHHVGLLVTALFACAGCAGAPGSGDGDTPPDSAGHVLPYDVGAAHLVPLVIAPEDGRVDAEATVEWFELGEMRDGITWALSGTAEGDLSVHFVGPGARETQSVSFDLRPFAAGLVTTIVDDEGDLSVFVREQKGGVVGVRFSPATARVLRPTVLSKVAYAFALADPTHAEARVVTDGESELLLSGNGHGMRLAEHGGAWRDTSSWAIDAHHVVTHPESGARLEERAESWTTADQLGCDGTTLPAIPFRSRLESTESRAADGARDGRYWTSMGWFEAESRRVRDVLLPGRWTVQLVCRDGIEAESDRAADTESRTTSRAKRRQSQPSTEQSRRELQWMSRSAPPPDASRGEIRWGFAVADATPGYAGSETGEPAPHTARETARVADIVPIDGGWLLVGSGADGAVWLSPRTPDLDAASPRVYVELDGALGLKLPTGSPACVDGRDALTCLVEALGDSSGQPTPTLLVVPRRGRGSAAAAGTIASIADHFADPVSRRVDRSRSEGRCASRAALRVEHVIDGYCERCGPNGTADCDRAQRLFCEHRRFGIEDRTLVCQAIEDDDTYERLVAGDQRLWIRSATVGVSLRPTGTPQGWDVEETELLGIGFYDSPVRRRLREAVELAAEQAEPAHAERLEALAHAMRGTDQLTCADGRHPFACVPVDEETLPLRALTAGEPFTLSLGAGSAELDFEPAEASGWERAAAGWRVGAARFHTSDCREPDYRKLVASWRAECAALDGGPEALDAWTPDWEMAVICKELPKRCPFGAGIPAISEATERARLPISIEAPADHQCGVHGVLDFHREDDATWRPSLWLASECETKLPTHW